MAPPLAGLDGNLVELNAAWHIDANTLRTAVLSVMVGVCFTPSFRQDSYVRGGGCFHVGLDPGRTRPL